MVQTNLFIYPNKVSIDMEPSWFPSHSSSNNDYKATLSDGSETQIFVIIWRLDSCQLSFTIKLAVLVGLPVTYKLL